jgi:MerR family transcriptional regulator, heat shock protein HspR
VARKILRIHEVVELCGVDEQFVLLLEKEEVIRPVIRRKQKMYPLDQVDRVRVAHVLQNEMQVNLAGIEVALHMREQMIAMQRKFETTVRELRKRIK